jgi:hypothetical protein
LHWVRSRQLSFELSCDLSLTVRQAEWQECTKGIHETALNPGPRNRRVCGYGMASLRQHQLDPECLLERQPLSSPLPFGPISRSVNVTQGGVQIKQSLPS